MRALPVVNERVSEVPIANENLDHDAMSPRVEKESMEPAVTDRDDADADGREAEAVLTVVMDDKSKPTKKLGFPTKSQDERWLETLDWKLKPLLEDVDISEYMGRDIDE
jgi:hypothetical protein